MKTQFKLPVLALLTLLTLLMVGCKSKTKAEQIQGKWNFVSITNLNTMTVEKIPMNTSMSMEFGKDSVAIAENRNGSSHSENWHWSIVGDTTLEIMQDGKMFNSLKLVGLNDKSLVLEINIYEPLRWVLERK